MPLMKFDQCTPLDSYIFSMCSLHFCQVAKVRSKTNIKLTTAIKTLEHEKFSANLALLWMRTRNKIKRFQQYPCFDKKEMLLCCGKYFLISLLNLFRNYEVALSLNLSVDLRRWNSVKTAGGNFDRFRLESKCK